VMNSASSVDFPIPSAGSARTAEALRLPDRILSFVDAHRRTLFAGLLLLYVLGFNGQWRVERDSALYLTLGRNLAEGRGYTYQGEPHHLAMFGVPLMFAGVFKAFGADRLWLALVLMLLIGFAALALTYRLFLLHSGRPTAVLMTVGLGATRLFYRYCFELLSDMPFLLGVMAFLAGYEAVVGGQEDGRTPRRPRWFDWALLVGGLVDVMITRPTRWVLVLAIIAAAAWKTIRLRRGKLPGARHVAVTVAVLLTAVVFLRVDLRRDRAAMPEYEDDLLRTTSTHFGGMVRQAVTENIPQLCESTLAKALFGCPIGPGLNTLAAILVVGLGVWLLRRRVLWGLWVLGTIAMLLVFKPLDRYMLQVLPLLVFAWWSCLRLLHGRLPARWADLVFLGLLAGGVGTNLARLGEIVVEQRRTPFLAHYHEGRYASLPDIGQLLREKTRPTDEILVGSKEGRVIAYVSRRNTFKPNDPKAPDLAAATVFALVGPSWDEGRSAGPAMPGVQAWVEQRGYALGPQVGPSIQHRPEKEPWRLYRVVRR